MPPSLTCGPEDLKQGVTDEIKAWCLSHVSEYVHLENEGILAKILKIRYKNTVKLIGIQAVISKKKSQQWV